MDGPGAEAQQSSPRIAIVRASRNERIDAVRLVEEYQDAVGVVVRDTPSDVSTALEDSSDKAIWIAYEGKAAVGCVAFRKLLHMPAAGEVKRLYVQPGNRGRGIAEALMKAVEVFAATRGCASLYLDTKDDLVAAIRFYERAGYTPCDRYNDNPQATIFMRKRLLRPIIIRRFAAADAEAFRLLNEAWITALFKLEDKDREVLGDPVGKIIAPGGQIFMAERDGVCIGCCALIAMGDGAFELAKMAVAETERGRGAGRFILEWVVAEMRAQGVRRLFLETNSKLQNAIHLYREVGFRQMEAHELEPSPYERADVSMELMLR